LVCEGCQQRTRELEAQMAVLQLGLASEQTLLCGDPKGAASPGYEG
jgi:hypothetical protein